jgi:hypothetical protein
MSGMKFKSYILAGISLLALVSCQELFTSDRTGKPVTFSASSDVDPATKTAYSGEVINGRERINWVDKDPVRMFMLTHDQYNRSNSETDTKTYYVVDIREEGDKSLGKVAATGAFLTWQEGKMHDFYSIYPGNYIGSADITGDTRKISLTLPSAQHGDIATNMRYAYMAAIHEGYETSGRGSVVLDYYPMVTTVYITLNNNTEAPITVRSVRIKSTDSQPVVGTYTISSTGGTTPFAPQSWGATATSPEVSVVLDDATLQPGGSTTCVIFLMPTRTYNPSNLKLTVVTTNGVSDISMANAGNVQFEPCKKYNVAFNIEERPVQYDDLTVVMANLIVLSNSTFSDKFEYLTSPPGLYYKEPQWPRIPVTEEDLAKALLEVTEISNTGDHHLDYLMHDLTPADFAIFPNLQSINLSMSNNNNSFSVADLNDLIELIYAGTARSLSVANCSFDPDNVHPLIIRANSQEMESISLTNITGLQEIDIEGGENGGGGQIGNIFIQNCPDIKTIKVLKSTGDIVMHKAVFDNLQSVETIYIESANFTYDIEVSDCPSLKRFIVCKQGNWTFKNLSLSNCALLGDAAPDNSEYGVTGLNIEKVATNFVAYKYNCPNLGPTMTTQTNNGQPTYVVTFRE